VGSNKFSEVYNNSEETVGGDKYLWVGSVSSARIRDKAIRKIWNGLGGIGNLANRPDLLTRGTGSMSYVIENSFSTTVGAMKVTTVGQSYELRSGKTISIESGKTLETFSALRTSLQSGQNLVLTAGENLELICGKARISLQADGSIMINGEQLALDITEAFEVLSKLIAMNAEIVDLN